MRGLKPENDPDVAMRELEQLQLTPAPNAQEPQPNPQTKSAPASLAEARFEKILQQELSGTSFSFGVERQPEIQPERSQAKTKPKLTKLSKAKGLKASPFEGETILDKLVSFAAYLLKALERFFFRSKIAAPPSKPQPIIKVAEPKKVQKKKRFRFFR